ncbi:zinc ribbon domain-containing protein [Desulfococcus sp.]|uniref:zinc ribbon domain-containing protein n=1 Tax=Desulfococcus sp. TaxID=2025834 RepID=UPI0035941553
MAIETKDQFLERMMMQEKPNCPHCNQLMSVWEVPPINFSDGLGWGAPYLFVCFNDDCSLYKDGWQNIEENYGHLASYRCICYLGEKNFECMPVFSAVGGTGQVIDDQVMLQEEVLKENIKKGFSILADCYVNQNTIEILRLLLDSGQPARVRLKAAEMMGDIGPVEAVDALKTARFGNEKLQEEVLKAVRKIHERHFTRECPFCAEIIKSRAKICRHCGKEVAGE